MSDTPDEPKPQLQTESSGSDGGWKIKTAVGLGGSGDGNWEPPDDQSGWSQFEGPIRHAHLKDIAVVALAAMRVRSYRNIRTCIEGQLPPYCVLEELADALTVMVLTAYTVAQHLPRALELDSLRTVCPYFSYKQLLRIRELADRDRA